MTRLKASATIASAAPEAAQPAAHLKAVAAATAGSFAFGLVPMLAQSLYREGMRTPSLLFWRYSIAVAIVLILAAVARESVAAAWRAGGYRIAIVGALLGTAQTLCYFQALRYLPSSLAILLFYTYPAITLAVDRFLFGATIRPMMITVVAIIVAGAALIAAPGLGGGNIPLVGFVWLVPSPILYSLYLAANAKLMAGRSALSGAALLYGGMAAAYAVLALAIGMDRPVSAEGWLAVLFIALCGGAFAITLFTYSIPLLGPSSYGIVSSVELVTVVTLGVAVLGDAVRPAQWFGALLILAGVLLYSRYGGARPVGRASRSPLSRRGGRNG